MKHFTWTTIRPEFTEECILILGQWWSREGVYEYQLYQVKKLDGEEGWYWGLLCGDGEEWGDIGDVAANLYFTMPLLNSGNPVQECDTTKLNQGTER